MRKAQEFSKNPLGIIALFIVLVYGIAALVLGFSGANLRPDERLPLIWFLVIFPIIVLVIFYLLVTRHHVKLYAPQDFPDKEGFFRALSPLEQKQKLDEEVHDIETKSDHGKGDKVSVTQRQTDTSMKYLTRADIVLAEDLALREIESEFGGPIYRNVVVAQQFPVDGVLTYKGNRIVVEVKYVRTSFISLLKNISHIGERFRTYLRFVSFPPTSFILAVVVEDIADERKQTEIKKIEMFIRSLDLPIRLRVYDFSILKNKYGITSESTRVVD